VRRARWSRDRLSSLSIPPLPSLFSSATNGGAVMLRGIRAFVHELETIITTDHHLPFRILGVIGAAFAIAFVFEAGPVVVFAVLVMGCIAAAMENTAGSNKN
jgi:hypothetical protein